MTEMLATLVRAWQIKILAVARRRDRSVLRGERYRVLSSVSNRVGA